MHVVRHFLAGQPAVLDLAVKRSSREPAQNCGVCLLLSVSLLAEWRFHLCESPVFEVRVVGQSKIAVSANCSPTVS